jgi:hypothetical protein
VRLKDLNCRMLSCRAGSLWLGSGLVVFVRYIGFYFSRFCIAECSMWSSLILSIVFVR